MKTMLKRISVFALAALMMLALVSCGNKASAVKKAFEKADYKVETVKSDSEEAQTILKLLLNEEQMKEVSKYELMICKMDGALNIGKTAIIIKFPGSGDVKDFLTVEKDGKKDTSAYDKAKEDGIINGNCMIITASSDSKDIFKKA